MPPEQIAQQRCDEYSEENSLKLEANVRVFATLLKSTTGAQLSAATKENKAGQVINSFFSFILGCHSLLEPIR